MWIGIDTSCYTTSFAAVGNDGSILAEERRLLQVKMGSRGLAQSAALFQHIREGKDIFTKGLQSALALCQPVRAVCVSSKPRPEDGSYMPVFLAGVQAAEIMGACFGVPVYHTSHQEGHVMAGIKASAMPDIPRFLAVHLSGGTSELLLVEKQPGGFAINRLGGTIDLHAGQLVDRIGVAMGEQFPCGPALDRMALVCREQAEPVKSSVKGYDFSLSGAETELLRRLEALRQNGAPAINKDAMAQAAFRVIATSLEKVVRRAVAETKADTLLLVGGVAGSQYLKLRLQHRLHKCCRLYFTPPNYSKDNAYGVALLGLEKFKLCE